MPVSPRAARRIAACVPSLAAMCLLIAVLASGCNQDPSPTSLSVLPTGDLADVRVFDSVKDSVVPRLSSFVKPITSASSTLLSIGRSGSYEATTLIRWISLPVDIAGSGAITGATVRLHTTPYAIGGTGSPFSFEARAVTTQWSSYTFTSDSLPSLGRGAVAGSYDGVAADTVLEFAIDTTLVRQWLMQMSVQDYANIRGLVLEGTPSTQSVRAFSSSESATPPELHIAMNLGGVDTTFVLTNIGCEDTFVATGPPLDTAGLAVHGGLAYRGRVFFDLSRIPQGSIINSATLSLTVDTPNRRSTYRGIDSVLVFERLDAVRDSLAPVGVITTPSTEPDVLVATGSPLLAAVQHWVNRPSENLGFVVVLYAENTDLDYVPFLGDAAALERRPRIVVTYTRKP